MFLEVDVYSLAVHNNTPYAGRRLASPVEIHFILKKLDTLRDLTKSNENWFVTA